MSQAHLNHPTMPTGRSRRRLIPAVGLLLTLALLLSAGIGTAAAAPTEPTLGLAGLQTQLDAHPAGVLGTFKTVVGGASGQTPVEIPMTVLAIVGNAGPDGALILFQADMTHPVMAAAGGIAEGMSGSPLYVDDAGTVKLIGALSYGSTFTTGGLGLATPIEYMSAIETSHPVVTTATRDGDDGATAPQAQAVTGTQSDCTLAQLPSPLHADGRTVTRLLVARTAAVDTTGLQEDTAVFSPLMGFRVGGLPYDSAAYAALAAELTDRGHTMQPGLGAGAAGWDPDYETTLEPGSACAAMYTQGDLWAGAIGTTTYVQDDVLLAMGHYLDWCGVTSLFLTNAWIDGVWPSAQMPYKVGSPGKARGTVTQDRGSGLGARLDRLPDAALLTATATVHADTTTSATSATQIASTIADSPSGALYAAAAAAVPVYKAADVGAMSGSAHTKTTIVVTDGEHTYTVPRQNIWDDGSDITFACVMDTLTMLSILTMDPDGVAPAHVVSIDVDAEVSTAPRVAELTGITAPGGLHRGDNTVLLRLSPYGSADDVIVPAHLTLPAGIATDGVLMALAIGDEYSIDPDDEEWEEEYAARSLSLARLTSRLRSGSIPRVTLADLVAVVEEAPTNDQVLVAYMTEDAFDEEDEWSSVSGLARSSEDDEGIMTTVGTDYYTSGMLMSPPSVLRLQAARRVIDHRARTVRLWGSIDMIAADATVALYSRPAGSSDWALIDDQVPVLRMEDGTGAFTAAVRAPSRTTIYRAVWEGDAESYGAAAVVKIAVRPRVQIAARRAAHGGVVLRARVTPRNIGRPLAFEQRVAGRWIKIAKTRLRSDSVATYRWSPPAGTYTVRAHFLGSTKNATGVSRSLRVTVP